MAKAQSILVYSENEDLLQELLGKAQSVKVGSVDVARVQAGNEPPAADYGQWGAERVFVADDPMLKDYNPETYTDALVGIIQQSQPSLIMIGATKIGLELSGKVAQRLGIGIASWCVDFQIEPDADTITTKCMIYSGIGINTYKFRKTPVVLTVNAGAFEKAQPGEGKTEVIPVEISINTPALTIIGYEEKAGRGEKLRDAPVIVDVGLGFKEQEDLHLARELAELLDGKVTCSRPVSSEKGWFPTWVGLSGDKVAPSVCFTIGTSGAIQHVIGIRESKILVCVNNDENAAIFSQSDYGVLADLYEFLPSLIGKIRSENYQIQKK